MRRRLYDLSREWRSPLSVCLHGAVPPVAELDCDGGNRILDFAGPCFWGKSVFEERSSRISPIAARRFAQRDLESPPNRSSGSLTPGP